MHSTKSQQRGPAWLRLPFETSAFLIAGTIAALIWANVDPSTESRHGSYDRFVHTALPVPAAFENALLGPLATHESDPHDDVSPEAAPHATSSQEAGATHGRLTLHYLANDVLMAFFFAIAMKEVWESCLPGGALSNPRKAATPLLATLGGLVGPALVYLAIAYLAGDFATHWRGWAIPTATDIAFSYLAARIIFGVGHPAISFLLLLAIADDAAGLAILAVFYPQEPLQPVWFLLAAFACGTAYAFRRLGVRSFWWYLLIPGALCWWSFVRAGIHPALGLVPIIPFLPHAPKDLGLLEPNELDQPDTLSQFERFWKNPVEVFLGLFGLVNAGVIFSSIGSGTAMVFFGLLIGKPIGIAAMTLFAQRALGLEMPEGMTMRHVLVLGTIAAIGFTVALFVSDSAFDAVGPQASILASAKMGALLSFGAGFLAFGLARALGIRPEPKAPVAHVQVDPPA